MTIAVLCAMLAVLVVWGLGMAAVALMRRRPEVVLMAEGVIDNATFATSGTGYIRWRDVLGTVPIGKRTQRRLLVLVNDPEAVRGRLRLGQRMQIALVGMHWPTPVGIPEWLPPMQIEELQAQMERDIEAAGGTVFDASGDGDSDAIRENGAHGYEFGSPGGGSAFDGGDGGYRGGVVAGGDRGGSGTPDLAPAAREQPAG